MYPGGHYGNLKVRMTPLRTFVSRTLKPIWAFVKYETVKSAESTDAIPERAKKVLYELTS